MAREAAGADGGQLATRAEYGIQLLRRDHLELVERAVGWAFVGAPAAKLRRVPEARALHVIVGDFQDELRTERLPGKILALAPAARCARPPLRGRVAAVRQRPFLPRVPIQRRRAVGAEILHQLAALRIGEAGAHPDVLQAA